MMAYYLVEVFDAKDNEPVIVVGFENNKDGYSNIKSKLNYLIKPSSFSFKKICTSNTLRAWVIPTGLIYTAFY